MSSTIIKEKDIIFAKSDTEDLTADLYFPRNRNKLPALLLIHGGAWKAGSKEMFNDWGPYLAKAGFFVMSINYRLSTPENPTWPGVFQDVQMALKWLVDNAAKQWDIDVDRIGVIGESCGAQLAAILAIENQSQAKIRAVVGIYGVYDLEDWWDYTQATRDDNPVGNLFGAAPFELPGACQRASPAMRVEGDVPHTFLETHFFMIWGGSDKIVPPSQSENFVEKLERLGMKVETYDFPNAGHYWFSILPWMEGGRIDDYPNRIIAPKIVDFLKKELVLQN